MSACQLIFEKSNQSMEGWNNLEKSIQYSSCVYMELQKCKNDAMKTEPRIETSDQGGKPCGASVFRLLEEISTRIVRNHAASGIHGKAVQKEMTAKSQNQLILMTTTRLF